MEMLEGDFNQKDYDNAMMEINQLRIKSYLGGITKEEEKRLKDLEERLKTKCIDR